MKADDLGLEFFHELAHRRIEGRAVGGVDGRGGIEPEFLVSASRRLHSASCLGSAATGLWQKKFILMGAVTRWRMMLIRSRAFATGSIAQGSEPSPPPAPLR